MTFLTYLQKISDHGEIVHVIADASGDSGPIGKILYVGHDFLEIQTINEETGEDGRIDLIPMRMVTCVTRKSQLIDKTRARRALVLMPKDE